MRTLLHPDLGAVPLSAVLHALSDPTRLEIVRGIAGHGDEIACCELGLDQPKATLSHHFKVLREAGIIRVRGAGTQHMNSLRRVELERRFPGLLKCVLAATREHAPLTRRRARPARISKSSG